MLGALLRPSVSTPGGERRSLGWRSVTEEPTLALTGPLVDQGVFAEHLERSEAVRWLLLAISGFVVGEIVSTVTVLVTANLTGNSAELSSIIRSSSPPEWYVISGLVGLWVGFLGAPLVAIRWGGPLRRHLGVSFRPLDLLGVVVGIGLQLVVGLLYEPFRSHLRHFDAPITKLTGSSHGGGYFAIIVLTVFFAPAAEEIFFRGLLLRSLVGLFTTAKGAATRRWGLVIAVLLDGLLFGLSHGEMAQLPGLALVGVVLSLLFLRTGRLGTSMVTHMSFNAVAVASYASSSGLILWLH